LKEIVPGGLCINDSNLVLEAVRLGKGIALERRSLVQDALSRGELVQLTSFTAPYPWPYWLVSSQARRKAKPFYLRPGLMRRLPRRQQTGAVEEKCARAVTLAPAGKAENL
jgi:LysR family glycine cleavage system transcriptional activator